MIARRAIAGAAVAFGTAVMAQPYDDATLIRQIGFVAGQGGHGRKAGID